jgi:hypothetical protein
MNAQMLSFPAPEDSPLTGDPYHKLFHLGMHHIGILFGYAEADIWRLAPGTAPDAYPLWPEGAAVVLTSNMVRNSVAWRHSPPIGKDTLLQVVALDRPPLTLTRQSDGTFRAGVGAAAAVVVREAVGQGAHVAILDGPDLVVDDETWLTARLVVAGQPIALGLVRHGPMQFAVHGNTSAQALRQAPKLTVRAIAVRAAFGARPPRR